MALVVLIALSVALALGSRRTAPPRSVLSAAEVASVSSFPYAEHDLLLRRFVDEDGRVDYRGLRRERASLDRLLAFVAQAGPSQRPSLHPTARHRMAFAIAAYNATVWRSVLDRPPLRDIDAVKVSFFFLTRHVSVDRAARRVALSRIFDWYASDFIEHERRRGRGDGDRITFINRYRDAGAQVPRGFAVDFIDYDWTINAQHRPGEAPSS